MSVSLLNIGMTEAARGDLEAACRSFREGQSIIAALAEKAGDIHQLQQDLADFAAQIAKHCGGREAK